MSITVVTHGKAQAAQPHPERSGSQCPAAQDLQAEASILITKAYGAYEDIWPLARSQLSARALKEWVVAISSFEEMSIADLTANFLVV